MSEGVVMATQVLGVQAAAACGGEGGDDMAAVAAAPLEGFFELPAACPVAALPSWRKGEVQDPFHPLISSRVCKNLFGGVLK